MKSWLKQNKHLVLVAAGGLLLIGKEFYVSIMELFISFPRERMAFGDFDFRWFYSYGKYVLLMYFIGALFLLRGVTLCILGQDVKKKIHFSPKSRIYGIVAAVVSVIIFMLQPYKFSDSKHKERPPSVVHWEKRR